MTPRRLGTWASVLFLVSGCAGAAVRGEFDRQIAGVQATARAEADAQGPAGARLRAWCMSQRSPPLWKSAVLCRDSV